MKLRITKLHFTFGLTLSLCSLIISGVPAYAVGSAIPVSQSAVTPNTLVSICGITFDRASASSETLDAYQTLQAASAYQRDWNLMPINRENPLDQSYTFTHKTLPGYGMSVDQRIYDSLMSMLAAGTAEGCSFSICSAYRSFDRQTQIYNSHISTYRAQGYTLEQAKEITELSIAIPGSSEHQSGLAVDIVSTYYQVLNAGFANTTEARWLKEHAHEYGFILRYPEDKTALTQITFEPWHFRYVGVEAAAEIKQLGICYEEYIQQKEAEVETAKAALLRELLIDEASAHAYSLRYNPDGVWRSDVNGYQFTFADGTAPKRSWILIEDNWYYFLPSGYMAYGWQQINDSWYYFDENPAQAGILKTGWYQDRNTGKTYYLNEANHSGEMMTGWVWDGTRQGWYYFGNDGFLLQNTISSDGYMVNEEGKWVQP